MSGRKERVVLLYVWLLGWLVVKVPWVIKVAVAVEWQKGEQATAQEGVGLSPFTPSLSYTEHHSRPQGHTPNTVTQLLTVSSHSKALSPCSTRHHLLSSSPLITLSSSSHLLPPIQHGKLILATITKVRLPLPSLPFPPTRARANSQSSQPQSLRERNVCEMYRSESSSSRK